MIHILIWLLTVEYNAPTWELAVDYCLAEKIECKEMIHICIWLLAVEYGCWKAIVC